ncbi:MAG: HD domain-containing protein, partial [Anaeroplasmataceae bacterium]|nr:HD domain-containing protein [Anaeroplasmataceae bacterium]
MTILERTQQFTDIVHNTILYSGLEGIIISTPIFNRLHRILQSSLVYLTFSSNKVKRFEHSIGTMHIAGEIFYHSINNTRDNTTVKSLLSECKNEIKKWYKECDFLSEKLISSLASNIINSADKLFEISPPDSNIYNTYFPNNIEKEDKLVYLILFQSVRLAGLLHDVGHLPYSHVFEYATKLLYDNVLCYEHKKKAHHAFLDIMKEYFEDEKVLHEEIGIRLLPQIKAEIEEYLTDKDDLLNFFVVIVLSFVEKILKADSKENSLYSDLHRIISGIADADRLDYCTRDALCSA